MQTVRGDLSGPAILRAPSGAWIVVGVRTALRSAVVVPAALVPEWDASARRQGDGLLVVGSLITDRQVLSAVEIPAGLAAVQVHPADVPKLGTLAAI